MLNASHTVGKVWVDTTLRSDRDAKIRNRQTGLWNPSGKGSRPIIIHAGSDSGFVGGCLGTFYAVKSEDYLDEIEDKAEKLFASFLSKIAKGSVIVMDN